jgi:transcriptional regulator with XRE-family HTH domain
VSNPPAGPEALQEVGEIIRVKRMKAGLTQAQLGTAVDLDTTTICRIEQGQRSRLEAATLFRIAQVLGINLAELAELLAPRPSGRRRPQLIRAAS